MKLFCSKKDIFLNNILKKYNTSPQGERKECTKTKQS